MPVDALRLMFAFRFLNAFELMPMLNRCFLISPGTCPHSPPGEPLAGRLYGPSVLFSRRPVECRDGGCCGENENELKTLSTSCRDAASGTTRMMLTNNGSGRIPLTGKFRFSPRINSLPLMCA